MLAEFAAVLATAAPAHVTPPPLTHAQKAAKRSAHRRHRWHMRHPLQTAGASWFDGTSFACGSSRGPGGLGVAHKTLPCGTKVRLCYRRCSFAWVVDRGPFIAGREWDLLPETRSAIGFGDVGGVRWRLAYPR